MQNDCSFAEETVKVLKLSLTEFSLPKFYQLFGISKVGHSLFAPILIFLSMGWINELFMLIALWLIAR